MVSRSELFARVDERYPVLASRLLAPLLDYVALGRSLCRGDLDKLLILMVIGLRATEHQAFATYTQAELLSGEVPVFPSRGVNIQSVADSLGAPKETVRRKVAQLADAGWIHREGGDLHFTAAGYQALNPLRERLVQLAVRNFETLADLPDGGPGDA